MSRVLPGCRLVGLTVVVARPFRTRPRQREIPGTIPWGVTVPLGERRTESPERLPVPTYGGVAPGLFDCLAHPFAE